MRAALIASALLCLAPELAVASSVIVPDSYPTIRQAKDPGAGTIQPETSATGDGKAVWSELPPPPRVHALLAYDSAEDRLVLCGGSDGYLSSATTWTLRSPLNASRWQPLLTGGVPPPSDYQGSGAFDAAHCRVFMVGSVPGDTALRVWVLTLADLPMWTELVVPGGPSARPGAAVAYDPLRDRLIVHGGYRLDQGSETDEVWALSLDGASQWSPIAISSTGPGGLYRHSLVYDSARDRMIVASLGSKCLDSRDIYAFTLGANPEWSVVATTGYSECPESAVYDPVADELLRLKRGGHVAALALSTGQWRVLTRNPLGEMGGSALALDSARRRLLVYGGWSWRLLGTSADLLALPLAGGDWENVAPYAPGNRLWHQAVVDRARNRMVVCGGRPARAAAVLPLSDTGGWAPLSESGPSPRHRFGFSLAYDDVHDRVLLFGGQADDGTGECLSDLWSLSLGANPRWTQIMSGIDAPGAHRFAGVLFDAKRDRLLIFGGDDGVRYLQSVWQAKILGPQATWTQLVPDGQLPFVYGQPYAVPYSDDAWVLTEANELVHILLTDPLSFSTVMPGPPTPPPRLRALGFDTRRQRILGTPADRSGLCRFEQLWWLRVGGHAEWSVTQAGGALPSFRDLESIVYDAVGDRFVMYGGEDREMTYYGDTWALELGEPTPVSASLVTAEASANEVRIAWQLSGPEAPMVTLQRRTERAPWAAIATLEPDGAGRVAYEDCSLLAGTRYGYRLGIQTGGIEEYFAETWITVPSRSFLTIDDLWPNPTCQEPHVAYTLPAEMAVRVRVLDVQGRVVATLADGIQGAGRHEVVWRCGAAGGQTRAGVYFVRLEANGRRLVRRVLIVR